ncbi:MAG: VPLPA-CTERM sorting domain-containing protein [Pseudomonadota bacterium]
MKIFFGAVAIAAALSAGAASAATFTASSSFAGDLCATDADGAGNFDDCATIAGNTGVGGIHEFTLTGLDLDPLSAVTISLTSTSADLFNTNGTDNSVERFRLLIGGQNFGRLFDGNSTDETAINGQLGASVQQNITSNIARPVTNRSAGPLDLSFDISSALFLSLVDNDTLSIALDFRQDLNINQFSDPTASVSYQVADVNVIPLPATAFFLLGGLGALAAFGRKKSA